MRYYKWQHELCDSLRKIYPGADRMSDEDILKVVSTIFPSPYDFNDYLRKQKNLAGIERLALSVWY